MDKKSITTLEYPKILERLAAFTEFGASGELALALRPSADIEAARRQQTETSEARTLLESQPGTTIGGARDVRALAEGARRGVVLAAVDLLDMRATLVSGRRLGRNIKRNEDTFPKLSAIATRFPPPLGLVDAISKTVSDRGEVLDSASKKLATIRKDMHTVHNRLLTRMQKMVSNKNIAPHLQEALVTQRDGRYVIPVRAEAKGRIKGVVHDQSSSGATLFIEPLEVVDMNNAWRELQLAERDEERRILAEISKSVGEHEEAITVLVETLAELDLIFAKAKYADALGAHEPQLHVIKSKKKSGHPGVIMRLWEARHPLLEADSVVPIDLELDPQTFALVITGPNTGGKSVTLKTAGLLALMAQSGMHIPAQAGSEISVFKSVFADIGDEQSIEQSLSTFSGHITNIIRILKKANRESLIIIDELGAGTDPQEGAALAKAILEFIVGKGITTLVATHYSELKVFAQATEGVVNASVEFDLESLKPTYHLTIGLPGRSNALAIAKRLGLLKKIVDAARSIIDPNELQAEDLLDEIRRQRDMAKESRAAAEEAQKNAESMRAELAKRLEGVEDERLEILGEARGEAQDEIDALQEEIRKARRDLKRARKPLKVVKEIEKKATELKQEVEEPIERQMDEEILEISDRPIRLGDRVNVRSLGKTGVVSGLGTEDAEIQIGNLRVRARQVDLDLVSGEPDEIEKTPEPIMKNLQIESPGVELSLRGQRLDEAMEALDRYLDKAYLAGLPYARIIHGKGTGKLRHAVRAELKKHPHIERQEPGGYHEGGEGVTVAYFVKD